MSSDNGSERLLSVRPLRRPHQDARDNHTMSLEEQLPESPVMTTREVGDGYVVETSERVSTDAEAIQTERNLKIVARFDTIRHIVERKTDDPFSAVWRELVRFSGDDAARRAMQAYAIEDEVRLHGLRNEIRLGDAFFHSYRDADEIIDPMLLYYGAYSLAKALCYATLSNEDYAHWRKRPSHGISSKICGTLASANIEFQNNGTIQALVRGLGSQEPTGGTKLPAIDLFRAVPELDGILTDLNLGGTSALQVSRMHDKEPRARIFENRETIQVWLNQEEYRNKDFEREVPIFHALNARHALIQMQFRQVAWTTKGGGHADLYFMAMRTPEGLFFERRLPSGYYIPEMAAHLILLHLLADFARYHPTEWVDMVDRHTDEYALVREFIHVSEYKFPNLVLNELAQRNFIFLHY